MQIIKRLLKIALDKNSSNSAATVGMVKEIHPFTTNNIYRQYSEEFYDFFDVNIYGINTSSSGVIINSFKPNITIPNKELFNLDKDEGFRINDYNLTFSPQSSSKYTLCIVFKHYRSTNFSLTKYISNNNTTLLKLNYDKTNNKVNLTVGRTTQNFTMPSSFNGQRIVLWLAVNFNSNVTKVKISNYSSTITISAVQYNVNQRWKFTSNLCYIIKLMYSKNFYDFDSEQYHKIMIKEKLNGSYIV